MTHGDRCFRSRRLSAVGLGTHRGALNAATDDGYTRAIQRAIELGCNAFDTAINYRCQRSERVLGLTLHQGMTDGRIQRADVIVATKGGYIPFESSPPANVRQFVDAHYVRTGTLRASDLAGDHHAMAPPFLAQQITRSLANLRLEAVDIYYLHNPEEQRRRRDPADFERRMAAALECLESAVASGQVGVYGIATWEGLRVDPGDPSHLSLDDLVALARRVAGEGHHFRAIQLPFNLLAREAVERPTQNIDGERVTVFEAARRLGLTVFTSAAILQGQPERVPAETAVALGLDHPVRPERALDWVVATRGVACALVGMGSERHVNQNLLRASR